MSLRAGPTHRPPHSQRSICNGGDTWPGPFVFRAVVPLLRSWNCAPMAAAAGTFVFRICSPRTLCRMLLSQVQGPAHIDECEHRLPPLVRVRGRGQQYGFILPAELSDALPSTCHGVRNHSLAENGIGTGPVRTRPGPTQRHGAYNKHASSQSGQAGLRLCVPSMGGSNQNMYAGVRGAPLTPPRRPSHHHPPQNHLEQSPKWGQREMGYRKKTAAEP